MSIGQAGIYFDNHGARLLGTIFFAAAGEARPTALLLHGLPGIEKNHDLAHAFRDAGINAVVFHYRGCWGSEGDYTLDGIPSDVTAALDHLSSGSVAEVEPDNFVLVGHSLGGWAAVAAGSDARVKAVAALGALVEPSRLDFDGAVAEELFIPWLHGVDPPAFTRMWERFKEQPATTMAADLGKPLLVVHGGGDEVIPLEQAELLFDAALDPKELVVHPSADHAFLSDRAWLKDVVVGWVSKHLKRGRP